MTNRYLNQALFMSAAILWTALALSATPQSDCPAIEEVPGYAGVRAEYIAIKGAAAPATPNTLNKVHFLRFRALAECGTATEADAIIIMQSGFNNGPTHWSDLAAQLVSSALERSKKLEVWTIDRRGSQLEDTKGLQLSLAANNPLVAIKYYFGEQVLHNPKLSRRQSGHFPTVPAADLLAVQDTEFDLIPPIDLPFMAEWGFNVAAEDVEKMLALVGRNKARSNVFLMGHSQGGLFTGSWGGKLSADGVRRGHELVAGLIFVDLRDGPIGKPGTFTREEIASHVALVNAIRKGEQPLYGHRPNYQGIFLPFVMGEPSEQIADSVETLYAGLTPGDRETIFPLRGYMGHPAGKAFAESLRLTVHAKLGYMNSSSPIPGTFLHHSPPQGLIGGRLGQIDFPPLDSFDSPCAAPGPLGLKPPCPPKVALVDPSRIYAWLDGGAMSRAKARAELDRWDVSVTPSPPYFSFHKNGVDNGGYPNRLNTLLTYSPTRTNIRPVRVKLASSGEVEIDAGAANYANWYLPNRYSSDVFFLGSRQLIQFDRDGVSYDIDKSSIAAPILQISAQGPFDGSSFPKVTDYTSIHRGGVVQSEQAKSLSPIDPKIDTRLYRHGDFALKQDISLAGKVAPGEIGNSVMVDPLLDWVLARVGPPVATPPDKELGVRSLR